MRALGVAATLVVVLSACGGPGAHQAEPSTRSSGTPASTATATSSAGTSSPSHQRFFDVATPTGEGRLLQATQVGLGTEVPWSQVGRGWRLTLLGQGTQHADVFAIDAQLLDLVAPTGGRYQLLKTRTRTTGPWSLDDWSADGRTALLAHGDRGTHSTLVAVDLRTGEQTSVRLARTAGAVLRPDGEGLWVTDGLDHVRAVGWDGAVTARYTGGTILRSPQGGIVVGGRSDLTVVAADGSTRTLDAPARSCHAVRWWAPGQVLEQCFDQHGTRLAALPLDGGPASWISLPHGKNSNDLGDADAYLLDGTTYMQVDGACGYTFLGRQDDDGSITDVDPPDAIGNVVMQGVLGHDLLVTHEVSCEPPGPPVQVLAAYDPVAQTERVLTRLPEGERFGPLLRYDAPAAVGW